MWKDLAVTPEEEKLVQEIRDGKKIPLFINMHGSGFVKGRRDQDIVFCRNICSRSDCAIVDIDYVPALAMRYPGQAYACYDVMLSCADCADKLEIDRSRIPAWKSDLYQKMYVNPEDAGEIYCSPAFASDEQLSQMPPALMLYCENDMFCDEAAEFHRRLLALGVPVYGKRFLHSSHGFVVQRREEFQAAEQMILTALQRMM